MTDRVPSHAYHSQLSQPVPAPAAERAEFGRSVAFRHDITDGLPDDYDGCDVLYSELPWQNGMAVFNERAGVDVDYRNFLAAVGIVAVTSRVPTIVVTGRHAIKHLPAARQVMPISLNQGASVALIYNTTTRPVSTTTELVLKLAGRFDRVGDFCCGYGRTLRQFHRNGKTFVGSDYNATCIGYIAEHFPEWSTHVQP